MGGAFCALNTQFITWCISSVAQSCPTLSDPMNRSMPGLPVHHQLLELAQTHVHWVGEAIQPSHPLLSPSPSAFNLFPAIRVFSNESFLCIRWPKYRSFSFSISPSNEYSGLISFRVDCLDCLAVQGTLKSLVQHHSSKASILWHSAFSIVQPSHPYMTTTKTIALTRWTSPVAQLVKNPPAMWETWFDPWVEKIPWRRERLPTPEFWPGEFHGLYSPWGHSQTWLSNFHFTNRCSLLYIK